MEQNSRLIYETKRLMLSRYPRFASEIASANIKYNENLKYHTAATDGKNIFFDPNYLESLDNDDRLFLIAHELMHIKFNHIFRLVDKDGQERDEDVWNEATDAIINANLERDGFKIKDGYINMPKALNYDAEELYEKLLKEKQQNNKNEQGNEGNKKNGNKHNNDDHSLWKGTFEKNKESESSEKNQTKSDNDKQSTELESNDYSFDEKSEFEKNRHMRKVIAEENFKQMKEKMLRDNTANTDSQSFNLGNVGDSNNTIDWKLLLRREIEKSETVWSQNRSIAENNYAYRLEENDIEDEALTEVMVDVSGSVNLDMLKSFLRMLKPLLKESKLKVGCFNEKYFGMVEIKSIKDIDNFIIPEGARGHSAWTEDWDLAVRSFSKKKEINKIVFTDGEPCPGTMPKEDLKYENIIWIVYGNEKFKPCCGKVINITEEQLKTIQSCQFDSESKGRSR